MGVSVVELERRVGKEESPVMWAMQLGQCVEESAPSIELGEAVVTQLCFRQNKPRLWKFVDFCLSSGLLSPLHVLSLLSVRVILQRRSQLESYRLFLELFRRYAFSFGAIAGDEPKKKIAESVNLALQLSETYKICVVEYGHALVLFFFNTIISLVDSTLDDWGLEMTSRKRPRLAFGGSRDHEGETYPSRNEHFRSNEHQEKIRTMNTCLAMEVLGNLTETRKAMVLLRLVHFNMPEKFNDLLQRLLFLEARQPASSDLKSPVKLLARLSGNIQRVVGSEYKWNKRQLIGVLLDIGSQKSTFHCNSGYGPSACWVPMDIYMEKAMDGKQLSVKSAIDILAEGIMMLQVINQASWQETFLALWLSALRLVQRERDPLEDPIPHLESRLCVLLSIVPLAITKVLEDEANMNSSSLKDRASKNLENGDGRETNIKANTSRKHGLVSSLKVLGNFSGLLCPPASVSDTANSAATKQLGLYIITTMERTCRVEVVT